MSNNQQYGKDPVAVRESDHYQNEYVQQFVEKWDALIDWSKRGEGEGTFFIDVLKEHGAQKVLDVATGTGYHSVRLLQTGLDVVSADGSPQMLYRAFENAKSQNHVLRTVQADWRWLCKDIHEKFDAIICLGNSFTHLFSENDRRKALAEFYSVLKNDGVLVLDHRNYDGMLDHGFTSKQKYYYCGDNVEAEPEHVDEGLARFRYQFEGDPTPYYLNMFPLRKNYTQKLMKEVGFQSVETYGDFQETYRTEDPDFFIHIAKKEYQQKES